LRTIGIADQAIIIDKTPPVNGTVNDGPLYGTDLLYTKDFDSVSSFSVIQMKFNTYTIDEKYTK